MTSDQGDAAPPLADGRYRLVSILGEGGQATVYRAWDRRLAVWRAIKVLRPGSPRSLRARFEAEARTLARLHHPNLLVVHDVGEDGGRAFIVMALASESLADRLAREGPLPPAAVAALGAAVAGALSVAHAAGVVHRDIKPGNLLADEGGRPLLSDFGIALLADERRTRTDAMMGTPWYMAPEQRAAAEAVDARADLYALGATLYTALVGHEPAGPLDELSDTALGLVPEALRPALVRATARDPERRWPTAEALQDALIEAQIRLAGVPDAPWRPPTVSVGPPPETGAATWVQQTALTAVPGTEAGETRVEPARRRSVLPLALAVVGGGGLLVGAGVVVALTVAAGAVGWALSNRAPPPPVGQPVARAWFAVEGGLPPGAVAIGFTESGFCCGGPQISLLDAQQRPLPGSLVLNGDCAVLAVSAEAGPRAWQVAPLTSSPAPTGAAALKAGRLALRDRADAVRDLLVAVPTSSGWDVWLVREWRYDLLTVAKAVVGRDGVVERVVDDVHEWVPAKDGVARTVASFVPRW
jgi:tRNA A-37 threonylcarbamoyl transferase component Bud32